MKNKKKIILILLFVLLAAAAAGVGIYYGTQGNRKPVNVFPFRYIGMTEYWGDQQESYGPVSTDRIQTVYVTDTQIVTEVKVNVGDEVKKGDVLMTFDTTLSDLAVERKRLDVEKLKLQLEKAKTRLWEINNMEPMEIPEPSAEEEDSEDLGEKLESEYAISQNSDYDGSTQGKALICWMRGGENLSDSLLEKLRAKAEAYQRKNAAGESEEGEEAPPEEPLTVSVYYVIVKVTENNRELGSRTVWQGLRVQGNAEEGFAFRFFDAYGVPDHMLEEEDSDTSEPEFDIGSGYTAAQIAQMRTEQQKKIQDLEFQIKMAEADYKIMLTEVSDGNVYAEIDGKVVSVLPEEDARLQRQPMLKVSGGGGFYIQGSISELEKDKLQPGQEVTINDWNTGMTYTGEIRTVGDFPTLSDGWNGIGNPNSSYYPFTAFVDETADLQAGSYCSIQFSTAGAEQGVYLENAFIRQEQGRHYVYLRGASGKLEKRYVAVGKSLWGSYKQILSGITEDDLLAFPYGKNLKEGADTVESDLSVLYE